MSNTAVRKRTAFTVREMVLIAMMTAVMVICSWISIPASVPFTLQTFAVFTAVLLLGPKNGFFSILTYMLLGAVGVPVFAGFKGGLGVLVGSTGGYLLGFLLTPLLCLLVNKLFGEHIVLTVITMVIGLFLCYTIGTVWFIHVSTKAVTVRQALKWCVIPFVIPDLMKLVLAVVLSYRLKKHIRL